LLALAEKFRRFTVLSAKQCHFLDEVVGYPSLSAADGENGFAQIGRAPGLTDIPLGARLYRLNSQDRGIAHRENDNPRAGISRDKLTRQFQARAIWKIDVDDGHIGCFPHDGHARFGCRPRFRDRHPIH
jgi:hypothetical protein